jgi:hypothetical protein
LLFNIAMTIDEIRRANLLALIGERNISSFAREFDQNESYLSQIKNSHRNMGRAMARKLEAKARLPDGWMDAAHSVPEAVAGEFMPAVVAEPRKLALLNLFDGLTHTQQDELIRWAEAKELENQAGLTELVEVGQRKGWLKKA